MREIISSTEQIGIKETRTLKNASFNLTFRGKQSVMIVG
jgi:hypothetical protein